MPLLCFAMSGREIVAAASSSTLKVEPGLAFILEQYMWNSDIQTLTLSDIINEVLACLQWYQKKRQSHTQ